MTLCHLDFIDRARIVGASSSRLLYSYHSAIEGFAARLSEAEAEALRGVHGVIAVRPDRRLEIHTTYSYRFLGLGFGPTGTWERSGFGKGAIIGVLDTGVWPESPSFDDLRMPPAPARWRGVCEEGQGFDASMCNNKLIGARFYMKGHRASSDALPGGPPETEYVSARDSHGHGTHTSSTAAGAAVRSASVLGMARGEARGTAPGAHVAAYKVCWYNGCYSSDILAGIDDAIRDGVDVLSLSLGGFPIPLFEDSIAIGGFRATERGITVVCAAGNNGPIASSVSNEAPWVTTVGAGTLDRRFPAIVRLGNGEVLYGESMYPGNETSTGEIELAYDTSGDAGSEFCFRGALSKSKVGGKMVLCDRGSNGRAEKGEAVREAGGAAMILANAEINGEEDSVDVHVLPATLVGYAESVRLKRYVNATARPTARIEFRGTVIGGRAARAPAVALFSSRGPSVTNPSVLKPDVIAPGVNIIAAWPGNLAPTGLPEDRRRSGFSVLSGTSMACPHVSGIAALIRSAHPNWSPAAIRSAIMTTSKTTNHRGRAITDGSTKAGVFAMGAGHVDPTRAVDPGLVYDIRTDDYVAHLCTLGYTKAQVFSITHRNVSCPRLLAQDKHFSLNYPSVSVAFARGKAKRVVVVHRRVTNVGLANSTYVVKVSSPDGVRVRVDPERLVFDGLGQMKSYRVYFENMRGLGKVKTWHAEGELVWVHEKVKKYRVRSPVSVTWV
ncbi:Subtilisin-like protease SDD1 [Acorus gramineus]|uniref:Subtilisin-like protease SDD1 n=1 Tax=Acorus gramineus TaxID=55184 RepID=A0AAV9ASZ6_ACOGR|nr:Subtilisin-like protease SDD1 [Acorus gramineus]